MSASVTTSTGVRRRTAVVTGLTILLTAPLGMLGNVVVLGLGTDIDGTVERVRASGSLLPLAAAAFTAVAILDVVAAWGLARYFGDAHDGMARLAGWLRTAYAAVLAAASGQLVVANTLAQAPGADDATVAAAILGFTATWQLGLVVFAAHLALLATLTIRDPQAPSILGWIIGVASVAYAVDSVARLFLPGDSPVLAVVVGVVAVSSVIGEVGLAIWLLARGGRVR